MKVIYIAGKYRGKDPYEVAQNICKAEEAAVNLWSQGWAVICPHKNTGYFDVVLPDEQWIEGGIEILKRCDAIYMLDNWRDSVGACKELKAAEENNLEILYQ